MNPSATDLPLRDIQLPEPVSWWPPAPGWWLLLAVALVLMFLLYNWWRRRQQRRVLRQLQAELESLRQRHRQGTDKQNTIAEASVLLRRACLSFYPRRRVAALTGDAWLDFLDSRGSRCFDAELTSLLTEAPYRAAQDIDDALIEHLLAGIDDKLPQLYRHAGSA